MGKTALALNIAQHVATHPNLRKTVAVFSLEMSKEALLTTDDLRGRSRGPRQKFRAGYLNQEERTPAATCGRRSGGGTVVHR